MHEAACLADAVNNDVTTRDALHEKRSVKCGAGTISPLLEQCDVTTNEDNLQLYERVYLRLKPVQVLQETEKEIFYFEFCSDLSQLEKYRFSLYHHITDPVGFKRDF